LAALPGAPLLGVIGPSGSGKSSAVRAGLLPALAAGVLPGSERWERVVLRPGDQPLVALREAAGPQLAEPEGHLVLVVDQFEEVFTACRDESQRRAFVDAIVGAADRHVLVIVALRADFYGACTAYRGLAQALGRSQILVGPMRPDELERAIGGPAARAGLTIEPELAARLVAETTGRIGGLPLLSTALRELWRERSGNRLTLHAYERTGGVQGAVARLAETAYAQLGPEEAVTAHNMLLRLAGAGEAETAVRRRVPLSELDLESSGAARRALAVMTEHRLLTTGDGSVEVAHEALLREWPRLQRWLEQDADARRLHRHLTSAARDWEAGKRDPSELYRGARLETALAFAAKRPDALNRLERELLD
jgi:hypothetical protein